MTTVRTTTEEFPLLTDFLASRHEQGRDIHDEWWDGEYRTVTGPTPEHGEMLTSLVVFLDPLVRARGLRQSAPLNIGIDKQDCRVPDLGVYDPDTPRTSPAFLTTALLVIEILSPGEVPGAKLDFYKAWGVQEYLEIEAHGSARLLRVDFGDWRLHSRSAVLEFSIDRFGIVSPVGSLVFADVWPQV